jgi:UDP-N-acetylmuramoyl-tripeptide--D-alanyl-D-alanine ligase
MLRKILKHMLRISCKLAILRYNPFIIAITGNTGKTSTKEAVFLILKEKFPNIRKTRENFNTDIGVPLSILGLNDAKRNIFGWIKNFSLISKTLIFGKKNFPKYLVLELAADKPGEIEYFVKFLPISIGIVTAIGKNPVHLEFFPNRKSLINEKSWIVRGIKEGGDVILNDDDQDVSGMKYLAKKNTRVSTYGKNDGTQIQFKIDNFYSDKKTNNYITDIEFKSRDRTKLASFNNLLGDGYAYAMCAAVCCGLRMGIPIDEGVKILQKKFHSLPGRMSVVSTQKKFTIIDDTYNASPLSYINALETIRVINTDNKESKKILILGDMSEIGKETNNIHKQIIEKALGVGNVLVLVGDSMHLALKNIKPNTKNLKQIYMEKNNTDAFKTLLKIAFKGDIVLVKGSHRMNMDKIVELSQLL